MLRPPPPPRGQLPPGRCPRCAFPEAGGCLCQAIPRISVPWRVLVIRHASEIPRLTNSGRWAAAALENATVFDHALDDRRSDDQLVALLDDGPAWLLYPSAQAGAPSGPLPRTLVVPDATWAQARRMVQRIAPLRALPRLALPPPPPATRLRQPPRAGGMSTLEAIAGAMDLLGDATAAGALRALHQAAVEKTLRLKGMWPPTRTHHRIQSE
jgi:DTW domain-containing protein